MGKTRLEAFSDGVIAIIITIMVLELKVPHGASFDTLRPLLPAFVSYVLSFINLGIYWNNHHHLLQTVHKVDGPILWANMHLLFWLSLIPFTAGWMGENSFAPIPTAVYGVVLLFAGAGYYILQSRIIASHGKQSALARAVGTDWKGKASPLIYVVAVPIAIPFPMLALLLYFAVAAMWFVPDRRIERVLQGTDGHTP
jgi:uncharacterized membrane protein